ncbi:S9 family peptidase [Glycocaulis profundi]|nr:S9 family peptidase [Glycocaulis profundi]
MSKLIARAALGAAFAGMIVPAAMAQDERPFTIDDLYQLRSVGAVVISPDGERVAYTVSTPRDIPGGADDGVPFSHVWVADAAFSGEALVDGDTSVSALSWRADSQALYGLGAFGADAEDAAEEDPEDEHEGEEAEEEAEGPVSGLYEIPLDGGEPRLVYSHDTAISAYAMAPDGETLFVIAADEGPDRSAMTERGFRARVYEEDLTFSRVWRVDLSGAEPAAEALDLDGHASSLTLSDDGAKLAVILAPTPLVDDSMMEQRWHVVDAASGEVDAVIETEGKIGSGAFSPDNAQFAFLAAINRADSIAGTIHVADAGSGEFEAVAPDAEQHLYALAWQEDEILGLAHRGTGSALLRFSADGEEIASFAHEGLVAYSMSLHADSGTVAFAADHPRSPRGLWVGEPGDNPDEWTNLNPWLSEIAFGEQRVIRWEARDGVEVEGILITPRGEMPEGGWPLINVVHGGPEAHDTNGWRTGYSNPGQIAAGQGYAVLYPNYRGSTGRGFGFIELDHLDPPGAEFWDIVDGLDHLEAEGLIDRERVGITGGSYGGFASAWGATVASEHFAASVPFVALTDLVSFMGLTDIPVEMVDVHFIHYPWQNWDWYHQESPIMSAEGSTTATLIMHGEEDTRVAPAQGYILYRYLKLAGEAPTRLVLYPGEGHGLRRGAAQYDYAHRLMQWFDHYLKGDGGEPPATDLGLEERLGIE